MKPGIATVVLFGWLAAGAASGADPAGAGVRVRVDADVKAGRPVVVHVVVALCDNTHQGIVPVSRALGDGQNPKTNLYWGAAFGVRTFFERKAGWERIPLAVPAGGPVLEQAAFHKKVQRDGRTVDLWVVAEAWDGARIQEALVRFLRLAAGHDPVTVPEAGRVPVDPEPGAVPAPAGLAAAGDAHLVVFVGHNGLMDFPPPCRPSPRPGAPPRAAAVLACASRPYFLDLLRAAGAGPRLLTTGLMAPEAYVLDAAVTAFARGDSAAGVRGAAASAYARYQKCGLSGARRLFTDE
jgi:hypothetical protein